jgi:uncharacterized protein YndB with AHSA1/START domain
MTERSIAHGTFVVERRYPATPARVFAAWADPKIKARWFGAPGGDNAPKIFEFKVGGREYNSGSGPDGKSYSFDVRYQDIVPDNRIIYTYEMALNDERISVSVATIELKPEGSGTHMVVTEMGAYLDGLDNVKQREEGTVWLMDQLGEELKRQVAQG